MITIAFTRVPLVFNRVSCHVTSSKWHLCPLCLVQSFTVVNSSGCLKSRRLIIISIHLVVALFSRSNYDEAALLCCCTFKNACSRLLNFPRAMVATSRCGIRYLRDWHCSPHFVWLDRAVMYFFLFIFFMKGASSTWPTCFSSAWLRACISFKCDCLWALCTFLHVQGLKYMPIALFILYFKHTWQILQIYCKKYAIFLKFVYDRHTDTNNLATFRLRLV